jgi:hypothetical protein
MGPFTLVALNSNEVLKVNPFRFSFRCPEGRKGAPCKRRHNIAHFFSISSVQDRLLLYWLVAFLCTRLQGRIKELSPVIV